MLPALPPASSALTEALLNPLGAFVEQLSMDVVVGAIVLPSGPDPPLLLLPPPRVRPLPPLPPACDDPLLPPPLPPPPPSSPDVPFGPKLLALPPEPHPPDAHRAPPRTIERARTLCPREVCTTVV
jgi:hypothetical protein